MLGSYGLKTYIWNNRLKSILLLGGFPFLLLLISFAFALLISAMDNPDVGEGFANAFALLPSLVPVAVAGALIWFAIAWFANQRIVDAVTGAHKVDRVGEPRLWNILENLCISRGITMPSLRIIESDARNAFASGVRQGQYAVTVTRGLMDDLEDAELEAVLAHELTHIENRDVQLLVVAAVFVGIISLVGDLLVRSPRIFLMRTSSRSRSSSRGRGGGGGGAIILILVAVAIFLLARLLAIALRFAMSRKREYLADAGSVELTKNPDAMIGALRKVAGHSELAAPPQVREMFLDHPRAAGLAGLFASHPPIEDRIAALVRYGGGSDEPPATATDAGSQRSVPEFGRRLTPPPAATGGNDDPGPWGPVR